AKGNLGRHESMPDNRSSSANIPSTFFSSKSTTRPRPPAWRLGWHRDCRQAHLSQCLAYMLLCEEGKAGIDAAQLGITRSTLYRRLERLGYSPGVSSPLSEGRWVQA